MPVSAQQVGHWFERRYKSLRRRIKNYAQSWIRPARDLLAQRRNRRLWPLLAANIPQLARYSFIIVAQASDHHAIRNTIRSLRQQINPNWELILVAPASLPDQLGPLWSELLHDQQAVWIDTSKSINASDPSNSSELPTSLNQAYRAVRGDWFSVLEPGTTLTVDATIWLQLYSSDHPQAICLYTDEVQQKKRRIRPVFKPDYSRELLLSQPFTGSLTLFRTAAVAAFTQNDHTATASPQAPFQARFQDWCQYDFFLRIAEHHSDKQILHLPQLLATCDLTRPTTWQRNPVSDLRLQAMRESLQRRQLSAHCHYDERTQQPRIHFIPQNQPPVTIVIATRDHADYCQNCVESLRAQTSYSNYEIVVIDNQSTQPELLQWLDDQSRQGILRVHRYAKAFNHSDMHNEVILPLKSRYVVLLNNDVWGFSPHWLEELVASAEQDPSIAMVGAQLIYPDDTIQHGGVVYTNRGPFHAHANTPRYESGLQNRLHAWQELSAVTAALVLVRCDLYQQLGGFDADQLPTSYNDVDLCLRIRNAGYRCLYNPSVQAYHYESKSRGRSQMEWEYLRRVRERWQEEFQRDPFYQPRPGERILPNQRKTNGECLTRELTVRLNTLQDPQQQPTPAHHAPPNQPESQLPQKKQRSAA